MKPNPSVTPFFSRPAFWIATTSGVFFLLDQLCKYLARTNPDFYWYSISPYIGWELFNNPGIAFGIGIPNWFVLIITPIILTLLLFFFSHKKIPSTPIEWWALSLLSLGTLSNYIDRFLFSVTIDYIRLFTSIINIADLMIITGTLLFVIHHRKKATDISS